MADDRDRVGTEATARQHERAATVEAILEETESMLADHKFPTRREELAAVYAADPRDLPNETEAPGSVFDRLREQFGSARAAMRALRDDPGPGAPRTAIEGARREPGVGIRTEDEPDRSASAGATDGHRDVVDVGRDDYDPDPLADAPDER